MEMVVAKRRIEGSEAEQSFAFGFKVTPKAFQLMIAQLYKDRIAAFVRELSTNAYEAHQMVGTENRPFDVTIPTMISPTFKIRDYGPGLSVDQVKNIYTMLFESTKSESNDMGGCFGLGSKSPFAYHDNIQFAVTSFYNGKKYMYSVYKNEIGFPHMDLMQTVDTTESNGVEISIPISRNDFSIVESKAREVYKWFSTTPNLTNSTKKFKTAIPSLVGSAYSVYADDIYGPCAKMGNIVYPIDVKLCKMQGLQNSKIMLEFPIGALTPEPSREGLSYDRKTINAIEVAASLALTEMVKVIQPKIDACQDYFDACALAKSLIIGTPITINQLTYNGENLKDDLGYLNDKIGCMKRLRNGKLISDRYSTYIQPKNDVKFYVIDKKCHHNVLIRYDVTQKQVGQRDDLIYICNVAYDNQSLEDFCKMLRINPARVTAVSKINYVAPKRTPGTGLSKKHKEKVMEFTHSQNRLDCWIDSVVNVDTTSGLYVLVHNNYVVVDEVTNRRIHPSELDNLTKFIGYKGTIYGVKKAAYDKVKANPNWKNFLDKAKLDVYNLMKTVDVPSVLAAKDELANVRVGDGSSITAFIEKVKDAKLVVTPTAFKTAMDTLSHLKALAAIDISDFNNINRIIFNRSIVLTNVAATSAKFSSYCGQIANLLKEYPLFGYFRSYNLDVKLVKELCCYVNLKG